MLVSRTKRLLAAAAIVAALITPASAADRRIAGVPVLLGGMSRGGALPIAWAGQNPDQALGVINFVGGWLSEGCGDAEAVNDTLFITGGAFAGETLWLYSRDDPFFSIEYSRENFAVFRNAGGRGGFHEFDLAGENNGHWVDSAPSLWQVLLTSYLDRL